MKNHAWHSHRQSRSLFAFSLLSDQWEIRLFFIFRNSFYTKLPFPLSWWSKISWWRICRLRAVNFEIHPSSFDMKSDCIWRSISIQYVQMEPGVNSDLGNGSFWVEIRDAKHVDLLTSTTLAKKNWNSRAHVAQARDLSSMHAPMFGLRACFNFFGQGSRCTCRSTQVKIYTGLIASTDLWPQEMFTFLEMLALVELESSFGAYVCHRIPAGSTATSSLVIMGKFVFCGCHWESISSSFCWTEMIQFRRESF